MYLTHFSEATIREMLLLTGFRTKSVRGIKHSDWLRRSAALAARHGNASTFQQLLQWKPAAKFATWLTWAFGACDCLLVIAERPAEGRVHQHTQSRKNCIFIDLAQAFGVN